MPAVKLPKVSSGSFPDFVNYVPVGANVTNTSLSSAVTLNPANGSNAIVIQNVGSVAVRYTLDGTSPTASTGFQLLAAFTKPTIIAFWDNTTILKVIEASASGAINYQWVRILP